MYYYNYFRISNMDYEHISIRKISDFVQKFAKNWNFQKLHIADIIVRKHF
jgi:hypothetical protein